MLVSAGDTEEILDDLETRFKKLDEFRVALLPVEATLPRPKREEGTGKVEPEKAKRATRRALIAGGLLLILLVGLVLIQARQAPQFERQIEGIADPG